MHQANTSCYSLPGTERPGVIIGRSQTQLSGDPYLDGRTDVTGPGDSRQLDVGSDSDGTVRGGGEDR